MWGQPTEVSIKSISKIWPGKIEEKSSTVKYNLIKVYIELKRYETYLKALINELKNSVLTKAAETGNNMFKYHDAQVRIQQKIQCDFSIDATWSELQRQIDILTKQRKAREKMLKQKKVIETVDEETGEVLAETELPRMIRQQLAIHL